MPFLSFSTVLGVSHNERNSLTNQSLQLRYQMIFVYFFIQSIRNLDLKQKAVPFAKEYVKSYTYSR